MIEEALLVGLEGGVRSGRGLVVERALLAGDVRGLQRLAAAAILKWEALEKPVAEDEAKSGEGAAATE